MSLALTLKDGTQIPMPESKQERVEFLAELISHKGARTEDGHKATWDDFREYLVPKSMRTLDSAAVSTSNITPLLAEAMEVNFRLPLEPLATVSGLMNRVEAKGLNVQVISGALGGVVARDIDEGSPFPEVFFNTGGGMQTATIGKAGLAAAFTKEALRYATMDIMAMNLMLMGQALDRHREQKAVAFLRSLGTPLFDNAAPATSLFGITSGRDEELNPNLTVATDDIFLGVAHMEEEGFPVDIILVNPLQYFMFAHDPVLRAMMIHSGGGSYLRNWRGTSGPRDPWSYGQVGARGPSAGNAINPIGRSDATGIAGREHGMTSVFEMPGYFPRPISIIPSPFVPFDHVSGMGDMYLLSSGNVGMYLVDEDRRQTEWVDESNDTVKVKLWERYGYAILHEGHGVGVMRNIRVTERNYWDGTVTATGTVTKIEDRFTLPA